VVMLDTSVRSVDIQTITEWEKNAEILKEGEEDSLGNECSFLRFYTFLWRTNGAPVNVGINYDEIDLTDENSNEEVVDRLVEQESVYSWAVKNGLMSEEEGKKKLLYSMCHGDAQWALWTLAGQPAPSTKTHYLPIGEHHPCELWACDAGLIVREEQPFSDVNASLSEGEAISYLYYTYNRRSETSFPITVDQLLASCQNVVDYARTHGYVYGSSSAQDPTTDGLISCDRLVAKALYDLGYRDQPRGGITVINMASYLRAWGFEESHDPSAIRRGSIMLVRHVNHPGSGDTYCHAFVVVDYDPASWMTVRYDCGTNGRIRAMQPLSVGWGYLKDQIAVFNIPQ